MGRVGLYVVVLLEYIYGVCILCVMGVLVYVCRVEYWVCTGCVIGVLHGCLRSLMGCMYVKIPGVECST